MDLPMSERTAWDKAAAAEGTTDSERILMRLARKAFLSLWSYPNVYSDEGRSKSKGDGKELVDLLVVFGDNVLLFSDKHCEYHADIDVTVAWPRWYRRAIDKSARQLAGAESFLRRFPGTRFPRQGGSDTFASGAAGGFNSAVLSHCCYPRVTLLRSPRLPTSESRPF